VPQIEAPASIEAQGGVGTRVNDSFLVVLLPVFVKFSYLLS
jgi:hypothetical protein